VHLLLLLLLVSRGEQLWSRGLTSGNSANPGGSGSAGGGGGNRVAYITLPSAPEAAPKARKAPEPVRVSKPDPVVSPEQVSVAPARTEVADTTTRPDTGQSAPASSEPGTSPGAGAGVGGAGGGGMGRGSGADSGSGSGAARARPPEPRDMAFPFDNPPKELRGVSLSVTFWVGVDGRVERYVVDPEIKDQDYARKFDEVMRAFRFIPARAPDGRPIAGTTRISFTLPGKSSS
jgi:outer membrane biosynthesis protein TonB